MLFCDAIPIFQMAQYNNSVEYNYILINLFLRILVRLVWIKYKGILQRGEYGGDVQTEQLVEQCSILIKVCAQSGDGVY